MTKPRTPTAHLRERHAPGVGGAATTSDGGAGGLRRTGKVDIPLAGKGVVLGRSNVVARRSPRCCSSATTVTLCHSASQGAPIVHGRRGYCPWVNRDVRGSWLKPGATVIDVGINAVDDATKKQAIDWWVASTDEASQVVSAITPVRAASGPDHLHAAVERRDDESFRGIAPAPLPGNGG